MKTTVITISSVVEDSSVMNEYIHDFLK